MALEEKPAKPVPLSYVPAGTRRTVTEGESWVSIAKEHGLDPWDLIELNFPGIKQIKQADPQRATRQVNWYLREYVGCEKSRDGGRNWDFTSGLTKGQGAWKAGTIFVPLRAPAPVPVPPPAPREFSLYVIGSPSPSQKYHYQFVSAAQCRKGDKYVFWLVEKTGYELYGVSLDHIEQVAPGQLGWITPEKTLVNWLDTANDGVIKKMVFLSHGLRSMVALRYGWDEKLKNTPNYGLTIADIARIDPRIFATNPTIDFNSCNSGVGEGGNPSVAQALANRIRKSVAGWTGRTSYADINSGDKCEVRGSRQSINILSPEFWKERSSRSHAGEPPEFRLFRPSSK